MKKILIAFVFTLTSMISFAQMETLFSKARVVGAYAGPITEFSSIKDDITTSYGGAVGLVINNLYLGGYGLGSIDIDRAIEQEDIERIDLAHGGFMVGYNHNPHKLVHLNGGLKVGWGAVGVEVDNARDNFDRIFVLTPEVGVELNVFRFFRIGVSAGYRYVNGVNDNNPYFGKNDFNSFTGSINFRIGWFGRYRVKEQLPESPLD